MKKRFRYPIKRLDKFDVLCQVDQALIPSVDPVWRGILILANEITGRVNAVWWACHAVCVNMPEENKCLDFYKREEHNVEE